MASWWVSKLVVSGFRYNPKSACPLETFARTHPSQNQSSMSFPKILFFALLGICGLFALAKMLRVVTNFICEMVDYYSAASSFDKEEEENQHPRRKTRIERKIKGEKGDPTWPYPDMPYEDVLGDGEGDGRRVFDGLSTLLGCFESDV